MTLAGIAKHVREGIIKSENIFSVKLEGQRSYNKIIEIRCNCHNLKPDRRSIQWKSMKLWRVLNIYVLIYTYIV